MTLKEKATLSNPNYLFIFTGVQEEKDYAVILTDTSSYTDRYNQFTLTEGPAGDVDFKYDGEYDYVVYEQSSPTNIDPDQATGEVERGVMRLKRTADTEHFHDIDTSNAAAHDV